MSYSCCDFTDDILNALNVDVPDEDCDSPSAQADLALAEIERLQAIERDLSHMQAPDSRLQRIELAARLIRTARSHLREAGANNAADYVQRALKSVEGAKRHANRLAGEATPLTTG